jgi:predicted Rossmann-fold nucleotide-binding protein
MRSTIIYTPEELSRTADLSNIAVIDVAVPADFDPAAVRTDASTLLFACTMSRYQRRAFANAGAVILDPIPGPPAVPDMDWYPTTLYSSRTLMAGSGRATPAASIDQRIYSRIRPKHGPLVQELGSRLHDYVITEALNGFLERRQVVGIMGGHRMARGSSEYRQIVEISLKLSRLGFMIVTGGGPGAMEAGNLGGFLSGAEIDDAAVPALLDEALAILGGENRYALPDRQLNPDYLDAAQRVIDHFIGGQPEWGWHSSSINGPRNSEASDWGGLSASIPTWFYGHEPTNLFSSHIAKFFENSLREDGLVTVAHRGIIFAPGRAGTLQEIFADVTQNYYVEPPDQPAPMIFLGTEFWTKELNVIGVLESLARLAGDQEKPFIRKVTVCDSTDDAIEAIVRAG